MSIIHLASVPTIDSHQLEVLSFSITSALRAI